MTLSRRLFLRAAPAVVAAAPSLVKQVADNTSAIATTQAAQLSGVNTVAGCAPSSVVRGVPYAFGEWARSAYGSITSALGMQPPEWVCDEMEDEIHSRSYGISPDVASLKSVSLSGKVGIQRRRNAEAFWRELPGNMRRNAARDAFFNSRRDG